MRTQVPLPGPFQCAFATHSLRPPSLIPPPRPPSCASPSRSLAQVPYCPPEAPAAASLSTRVRKSCLPIDAAHRVVLWLSRLVGARHTILARPSGSDVVAGIWERGLKHAGRLGERHGHAFIQRPMAGMAAGVAGQHGIMASTAAAHTNNDLLYAPAAAAACSKDVAPRAAGGRVGRADNTDARTAATGHEQCCYSFSCHEWWGTLRGRGTWLSTWTDRESGTKQRA